MIVWLVRVDIYSLLKWLQQFFIRITKGNYIGGFVVQRQHAGNPGCAHVSGYTDVGGNKFVTIFFYNDPVAAQSDPTYRIRNIAIGTQSRFLILEVNFNLTFKLITKFSPLPGCTMFVVSYGNMIFPRSSLK